MINDASTSELRPEQPTGQPPAAPELLRQDWKAQEIGDLLINNNCDMVHFERAAEVPRLGFRQREVVEEILIRAEQARGDRLPQVQLEVADSEGQSRGMVVLELFEEMFEKKEIAMGKSVDQSCQFVHFGTRVHIRGIRQ